MNIDPKLKIAGDKTVEDWINTVNKIKNNAKVDWNKIGNDFLLKRIKTRYFASIKRIDKPKAKEGEGFAIVTIQCCLIEFLSSLRTGFIYGLEPPCGEEKMKSSKIFIDFIRYSPPFKDHFDSSDKASSFYSDVRCALIHGARTKNHWRIHAEDANGEKVYSKKIKEGDLIYWAGAKSEKVLFRDEFQKAFETYLKIYIKELTQTKKLQHNFIKVFCELCK